jgi:hypothetical protein
MKLFIHVFLSAITYEKKEVDSILHYKLIHQQAQESDGLIYLGDMLWKENGRFANSNFFQYYFTLYI